jgi:Kef-type K+ transport system membrane component KefB/nucleotide-binding universal stress UspA family protein
MIVASVQSEPAFSFMVLALTIIIGPLVAQKLRLPGLIGLLIAGAVIGPNMLGVLEQFRFIEAVGSIGVLYLIFLAGLGLDMKTFEEHRNAALSFGLITSFVPWGLGIVAASSQGYEFKTAVLIGSFWASFTLVSYGAVTKYGLTRNPSMAATVGASSITDTIGLVALAIIIGSETGDSNTVVLVIEIMGGLALLAAYCLVLLPWVTRWFFAGLGQERELRFLMILVGFLSAAVVAEIVGLEALIGAFFAGLGLNRLVPNQSTLMARIDFFGNALFIPAFLVSVGLIIDPEVLFQGSTLQLAVWFAAALLAGKGISAVLSGRISGFSPAEVGLMFSLSSAQAAATLASTIIGFETGLFGDEVVNAVMMVIVISLFVSSIGSSYFAPRVVPFESSDRRLGEVVLIPQTSGHDNIGALWLAGRLAESDGGHVLPLIVAVSDRPEALAERRAEMETVRATLGSLGMPFDPELRVDRSVAGAVDRVALEQDASLVLLTWPGRSDLRDLLLGGTNDEIAATTDRPIAVADLSRREFRRVLVALSDEDLAPGLRPDARMALELAGRLAGSASLNLAIGPVDLASAVTNPGEEPLPVPEGAVHLPGPRQIMAWVTEHAGPDDVVVVAARGNPFSLLQSMQGNDWALVAVSTHQDAQWYSSEGALGVTVPRTSR